MKDELASGTVQCPYCWESIELLIDPSVPEQRYVEDCSVCCSPMLIRVCCDEAGGISLEARAEND